MHFNLGAYPAQNRTEPHQIASSASRLSARIRLRTRRLRRLARALGDQAAIVWLALALVVLSAGCAAPAKLSPTARILVTCNPVAHAVDAAILGLALAVGDGAGLSGAAHQRGEWSLPGVMCHDAIADRVDAAENRPPRSPKGD